MVNEKNPDIFSLQFSSSDDVALAMGIDIGGSKTHALASHAGTIVCDYRTESANVQSVRPELIRERIALIFRQLQGCEISSIIVGAAGAEGSSARSFLEDLIREHAPRAAITVLHDSELLLPAAGVSSGIALLSGTGSVAIGVSPEGTRARAGGWGYLLGDEGSGFWIYREAVRRALTRVDQGHPLTDLDHNLLSSCRCSSPSQLLEYVYAHPEPQRWASHTPLILHNAEKGDEDALEILEIATTHLVSLATTVSTILSESTDSSKDRIHGPKQSTQSRHHEISPTQHYSETQQDLSLPREKPPIVLAGGLLTHTVIMAELVQRKLLEAGYSHVTVLKKSPAYGALTLAERNV